MASMQTYQKQVWSYWEGPRPEIVTKSIASWRKFLPDWNITVLSAADVEAYDIIKPQRYEQLSSTTKSDVVRLSLLFNYGGIWMDASVVLKENFDWLEKYSEYPLYAFKLGRHKYIESWFISVPRPKSEIILKWIQCLNEILDTQPHSAHVAYCNPCTSNGDYFMIYQAYCYLLQSDPNFLRVIQPIPFGSGDDNMFPYHKPNLGHMVKYTKFDRTWGKHIPFPTIYVAFLIVILVSSQRLRSKRTM